MSESEVLVDLIERWREGDQAAATAIFERYQNRVLRLAERNLGRHLRRRITSSEIMTMTLKSVLRVTGEEHCNLDRNGSLWGLVADMADKQIKRAVERNTAQKRDFHRETEPNSITALPHPLSRESSPDEIAQWKDTLKIIESRLNPESYAVLVLKLEGLTDQDIADQLGVSRRTVINKWKRVRSVLRRIVEEQDFDKSRTEIP